MTGELEEHVVERGLAQHHRRRIEVLAVEEAHRVEHRSGAGTTGHVHAHELAVARRAAHRREQVDRARGGVVVAHGDLDHRRAEALLQLGGRALGDHAAVVDDHDVVGEHVGLLEVLRGEQHGGAAAHELLDHAPELVAALRVEAGGGLVEEQHRRTVHERGGEVEATAHAAGVGARHAVGRVG